MAIANQDYIDAAVAGLEPKQAWKVLNVIGSGRLEGLEPSREDVDRLVQIASGAITIEEAIAELDARYKPTGKAPRPDGLGPRGEQQWSIRQQSSAG